MNRFFSFLVLVSFVLLDLPYWEYHFFDFSSHRLYIYAHDVLHLFSSPVISKPKISG